MRLSQNIISFAIKII